VVRYVKRHPPRGYHADSSTSLKKDIVAT
jgi:hypothetical protein